MTLIVCVDDRMGMSWCGKRQSRDRTLNARLLSYAAARGVPLSVSPYTAKLFEGCENIAVCEDPDGLIGTDGMYFSEIDVPTLAGADSVYLYRWGRHYPADRYFSFDLAREGYRLVRAEEFRGNAHEAITEEIYEKVR